MNSGHQAPLSSSDRVSLNAVVVIPAYQARGSIGPLVRAVREQGLPVIVVDDASSDETLREAKESGASVIRRSLNGGKGMALREGLDAALKSGYRWMLTMDADGQHLPSEIPRFLEVGVRESADLILGDRMHSPKGMPLDRWLTNRFMSWVLSWVAGQRIPDSQCGFRLISHNILEQVNLSCDRFETESELLVKSARAGYRIVSIPVSSVYRRNLSFIRPVQDTVRFFRFLFSMWRMNREERAHPPEV